MRVTVKSVATADRAQHDVLSDYEIEPGMLSVLTEYEEHRLRTNLQQDQQVFRVRLEIQADASLDVVAFKQHTAKFPGVLKCVISDARD